MAERKKQPNANRPLRLLHQLARHIVNGGQMVCVDRMAQTKCIG
jgi:hypothetical protein